MDSFRVQDNINAMCWLIFKVKIYLKNTVCYPNKNNRDISTIRVFLTT